MSNKISIRQKIDTNLQDASNITAVEHREVLHTDPDSFLEAIYKAHIDEVKGQTLSMTTSNANFGYAARFTKVGGLITISGFFVCSVSQNANSLVFTIDDSDYHATSDIGIDNLLFNVGNGVNIFTNELIRVRVLGNEFTVINPVLANEFFTFNITYTAVN